MLSQEKAGGPSQEIRCWLQQQKEMDMRCYPRNVGVLESNVSKFADKFDPISALDDEFYEYTGGLELILNTNL